MPIPDYQTLMLPVLEFAAARDETGIRDCIAALADKFGLTDDERRELLPSGKQPIFANRVHWARTYLAKAGVLEATRRAHFKVTPRGQEVLARQPAKLENQFLMEFPEFRDFRDRSRSRSDKSDRELISSVSKSLRRRALPRRGSRPPTLRSLMSLEPLCWIE